MLPSPACPLSVWVQLSRLPVLECPAVMGVEGRTGEGDEEMDSALRESGLNSGPNSTPRLPFQLLSRRSSVMGELLRPRLWDRSPELAPVLEMDMRDLEGLMDGPSHLSGSFLERWCSTLIIASFSMI